MHIEAKHTNFNKKRDGDNVDKTSLGLVKKIQIIDCCRSKQVIKTQKT